MRFGNTLIATSQHSTNKIPNVFSCTFVFLHVSSLKMIPCGSKHVGIPSVITRYKSLTKNIVHFVYCVMNRFSKTQGMSNKKFIRSSSGTHKAVSLLNKVVGCFLSWGRLSAASSSNLS